MKCIFNKKGCIFTFFFPLIFLTDRMYTTFSNGKKKESFFAWCYLHFVMDEKPLGTSVQDPSYIS